MSQLKEYLIWMGLGVPGIALIGVVLYGLFHCDAVSLVVVSVILGTLLMLFCAALCKSASEGDRLSEMNHDLVKLNCHQKKKGKLGAEDEDDCNL